MISLYDTLAGAVRPLELRQPGRVTIYACGPTVYDEPHLGHARGALTYDILRRYLQWRGLDVQHVANVTDIDDKIIERANREGLTEPELAARWDAVYVEAMEALGVLPPHQRPRATEWVDEMVDFVEGLMAGGKAYATESGCICGSGRSPATATWCIAAWTTSARGPGPGWKWTKPKRTRSTSPCGRRPSRASPPGRRRGARAAPAGTSSASP